MDYKNLVAERIKENTELEVDLIEKLIEIPPKKEMEIMLSHASN